MKVFIVATMTADGLIGRDENHLANWSSREDKKLFVRLTREAGVIVMGSRTYATIGRALPGRRMIVYTTKPETITAEGVETTQESPQDLVARLEREGANGVAVCGGAAIYTMFLQAGVMDELYLSVEPFLFGTGVPLFSGHLDRKLKLLDSDKLNDQTILLHYAVEAIQSQPDE